VVHGHPDGHAALEPRGLHGEHGCRQLAHVHVRHELLEHGKVVLLVPGEAADVRVGLRHDELDAVGSGAADAHVAGALEVDEPAGQRREATT
jgi:hypothetical protein